MPEETTTQKLERLQERLRENILRKRVLAHDLAGMPPDDATKAEIESLTKAIESVEQKIELLEVVQMIEKKVESISGIAKTLMPVGKTIIDGFKGDISEITKELVSALADVTENLDDQFARLSQITAHSRFRKLEQYVTEGFSKEQAFLLVLSEVKPVNLAEIMSSGQNAASSARKRKNS
ncbi:MAG: hypothetical protein Q7K65_04365 [Candidatus Buchananbacteria bacterium]|nr:hypothetical protein [Candidatus Buchananbacteria bacterium]